MAGATGPKYPVSTMDRYSPRRESMIGLRVSLLPLVGILVAPLLMAGYVGLTVVLFLPLLGLRRMFRRGSIPAVVRRDGDAPLRGLRHGDFRGHRDG
jgi:hypothetical protein